MAFKLTNDPLKNIDSTENRGMIAKAVEKAKAGQLGAQDGIVQDDASQTATDVSKSSQLDNIENKINEMSDNFNQSQEVESKNDYQAPRNAFQGGGMGSLMRNMGNFSAFFKKKKY